MAGAPKRQRIQRYEWYAEALPLERLSVSAEMLERHDCEPVHVERRNRAEARMTAGEAIPPLIALGERLILVDGYSRYRAIWRLGVQLGRVLRQRVPIPGGLS